MLYALVAVLFLFIQPAEASMVCDTTPESRILEVIQEQPDKLVRVLEGSALELFLAALTNHGYLTGTLDHLDRIYIVDAGKKPGYTTDNVWLFFVYEGCLIKAIPASKSTILGLLP